MKDNLDIFVGVEFWNLSKYSIPMDGYLDFSNGKLQQFNATHYIFCRSLNVSRNQIINFDFLAKVKGMRELIA